MIRRCCRSVGLNNLPRGGRAVMVSNARHHPWRSSTSAAASAVVARHRVMGRQPVVGISGRRFFHASRPALTTTIGILRETYDKWERRTPLCPTHVSQLLSSSSSPSSSSGENGGGEVKVKVLVQPSSNRIFTDAEYSDAGATLTPDLTDADVILGVKQPHVSTLLPNKTYLFFAHVIKGQKENMPLLQRILDDKIRLVDYECIATTTKGDVPTRLVAFGRYAGLAGGIDILQGLGRRLLASGYSTPFLHSPNAYMYRDLEEARRSVQERVGDEIASGRRGLPSDLGPLVFAFTGGGNVAGGAREVFELLPHQWITVDELHELRRNPPEGPQRKVYGVMVRTEDAVALKRSSSAAAYGQQNQKPFDENHYRNNPGEYEPIFHQTVAPYVNVVVNGAYWDERYPRLLTKEQIRRIYEDGHTSLIAIADISCDVGGSIEFLDRTTPVESPFFHYDPISGETSDEIDGRGITVMGTDILPTELPRESSLHFGDSLLPLLERTVEGYNDAKDGDDGVSSSEVAERRSGMSELPIELERACIARDGRLVGRYEYIEELMKIALREEDEERSIEDIPPSGPTRLFSLEGHLFDTGLINKALDVIEHQECDFQIKECVVGTQEREGRSFVLIRVTGIDDDQLDSIATKIETLADVIPLADATVASHRGPAVTAGSPTRTAATVTSDEEQRVLVLGAGRVASSLSEYLGRSNRRRIVVAGNVEEEVQAVARCAKNSRGVVLDVNENRAGLSRLVGESDVVVSLLPAPMHAPIAEECINAGKNMVTASYVSDEIRALHKRCEDAGIIIMNEVGLDPGMDHMSAMKIIDDVQSRGGRITSFSSVCGGLPAPEAADNPLRYKFSWSPMGVLRASSNSATYRRHNETIHVDGNDLLMAAKSFDAWPRMQLECLPNRDSIIYGDLYGIESAETIFRGTLRYGGFSGTMYTLRKLGLFDDVPASSMTWDGVLSGLSQGKGHASISDCLLACSGGDKESAERAGELLTFLHLNGVELEEPESILTSFCKVLERQLKFEEHERDMVLMHHDIRAEFDDGAVKETHHSSLEVYGDDRMTAMCKTVGYTAAVATDLVMNGNPASSQKGVVLPLDKEVYTPMLEALENEGLKFEETLLLDNADEASASFL